MNSELSLQPIRRRRYREFNSAIHEFKSSEGTTDAYRFVSMSVLTTLMMLAEMATATITGSLTIFSDSLHMLSDLIALAIGFIAHKKAHSSNKNKFEHAMVSMRYEILGALINGTVLLTSCFIMGIEAIRRIFFEPEEVEQVFFVLVIGGLGLFINIIGLFIFGHHGHSHNHSHGSHEHLHEEETESHIEMYQTYQHGMESSHSTHSITAKKPKKNKNLNIHGVFLHIFSDLLSSIAVIVSAVLLEFTEYAWWHIYVDPICTLLMVLIISRAAYPLMSKSITILLSKSPLHSDVMDDIETHLKNINGILNVHELYCFEGKPGYYMATVHLIVDTQYIDDKMSIMDQSKAILHRFGIHSSVVQSEFIKQSNKDWENSIDPCFDYVCNQNDCIPKGMALSNSLSNSLANMRKENKDNITLNIEQNQTSQLLAD